MSKFLFLITVFLMVVFRKVVLGDHVWKIRRFDITSYSAHIEFRPLINLSPYTLMVFDRFNETLPRSDIILMPNRSAYKLQNLYPGEKYFFHLCKTVIQEREKKYCVGSLNFFRTIPLPPNHLSFVSHTETELTVNWLSPPKNCTYSHFVISISGSTKKTIVPYHLNYAEFKNLIPGKIYDVSLTSASEDTISETITENFQTKPYPPTEMTITLSTSTIAPGLRVDWTDPTFGEFDEFVLSVQSGTFGNKVIPNKDWMFEFTKDRHSKFFYDLITCRFYRITLQTVSHGVSSHTLYKDIKMMEPHILCET